jgi:hypothetical protein
MPHVLGPAGAPPDPCPPPPPSVVHAGRQELHQRLKERAHLCNFRPDPRAYRPSLTELLEEAAQAVLTCPHEGCAYCFHLEREETP